MKENTDDMKSKGRERKAKGDSNGARLHPERLARGENHLDHKLTEQNVRDIRRAYADKTEGPAALARKYGVCKATLREVLIRKTWKHVIDAPEAHPLPQDHQL